MITTNVDVSAFAELRGKLLNAAQTDALLREIASGMFSLTRNRIHEQGENAAGRSLGTYSPSYLELRKKPTAKGGRNDSNPKIRFVFKGDMEKNYSIIPISDTEYGLGFTNPDQVEKADWLEQNPKFDKVWALTDFELDKLRDTIREFIQKAFK